MADKWSDMLGGAPKQGGEGEVRGSQIEPSFFFYLAYFWPVTPRTRPTAAKDI
jgi:hypothetical protein